MQHQMVAQRVNFSDKNPQKSARQLKSEQVGSRLYEHAQVQKHQKKLLVEYYKREEEEKLQKEALFRPVMMADSRPWLSRDRSIKTEDALMRAGLQKQQNIQRKKRMLEEKLAEDCNYFQPKIYTKSQKNTAVNSTNSTAVQKVQGMGFTGHGRF